MNLKTLREQFGLFKTQYLPKGEGVFLYEIPKHFSTHWNLEASNPKVMFEHCFQNSHTRRLWKREGFRPLEAMDLFWELDPEMVQNMFRDLFRETTAIDGRIGRFVFHSDQMLSIYRKANPASIFNSHYHDRDYWMISLYLSLRYPDQYCLYPDTAFRKVLALVQAKPIETAMPDLERFFKVSRTLYALMKKEEGLIETHLERLDEKVHYTEPNLLLVYEFLCFTGGVSLIP